MKKDKIVFVVGAIIFLAGMWFLTHNIAAVLLMIVYGHFIAK